jgi:hypothetical protein
LSVDAGLSRSRELQNYLDAKYTSLCVDSNGDNSGDDSSGSTDDGFELEKTNCNYNRAEEEFLTLTSELNLF